MFKKILLCFVLVLFIVGCGGKTAKQDDGKFQVGYSHLNFEHPFYQAWMKEAEKSDEYFGFDVILKSAESSVEKQISDIESFIALEVDAIIYNPVDVVALQGVIEKAVKAGIKTVSTHNIVDVPGNINCLLPERPSFGKLADITAAYLNYNGKVLYISGMIGNWASDNRQAGYLDSIAKYDGVELLDWQPANWTPSKAVEIVESWLARYPEIDIIACADDSYAVPILEPIKNAGRLDDIKVISYSLYPEAVEPLRRGEIIAEALIGAERNAWWTSHTTYRALKGEEFEESLMEVPMVMTQEVYDTIKANGMKDIDQLKWITIEEAEKYNEDPSIGYTNK